MAERLAGRDTRYDGSVNATNLKVSGVHVFSAGDFLGAAGTESIVLTDPGLGTYKKLVIADGRLDGAVLYGDTTDALWYLELIRAGGAIDPSARISSLVERWPGGGPRKASARRNQWTGRKPV